MKLIFLHGPPAAGKYTIAKELETLVGCGVFHNHLTIDAAKPFFEYGTESFWKLVRDLRFKCIQAGARDSSGTVVYTNCYDHPTDLPLFEQLEQIIKDSGSQLFPVYLKCEKAELERRISGAGRVAMGKVRTIEGLNKQLTKWNCIPVPRDGCVTVNTDNKSSLECAQEIIKLLALE